ncbi:MAG: ABC transporter permease [Acidimicrobiia bacterium]|nr:ABC transporter permease [Acidimicrobiia bacterium]
MNATTTTTATGTARLLPLLTWRYLSEYARRLVNLVLLAVVPVVFVTLSAGAIADFADALGGLTDLGTIEAATAGWAASLLAGIAGFFHVTGSREADRRLAAVGAGTLRVVVARLTSALGLALVAGAGALAALALRTGIADTPRVIGVTFLMALIYLGIGATVGALVRSEINGSLVVVFAWMFDVFFGPAMGGSAGIIRVFPLHFPTLVVTDVASGHAGPLGDLGISALWAAGALAVGTLALVATTRPAPLTAPRLHGRPHRIAVALRYGFRDYRRNLVLWVLLVGLPVVFITLSIAVTPDDPAPVELVEHGQRSLQILSMSDLHGAIMVPITVGFLAGLAGLFVALGSAEGDRRLVLAGYRPLEVLAARLGVILFAALLTTGVALAVTGASFTPQNWIVFAVANVLAAVTYGMIGVLVGPRLGLLGGLYVMLALPFIDIGIAQNAMFDAAPPAWAAFMPAHGAIRVLLDGAFTPTFDEYGALALAVAWLAGVTSVAAAQFHHLASPHHS